MPPFPDPWLTFFGMINKFQENECKQFLHTKSVALTFDLLIMKSIGVI